MEHFLKGLVIGFSIAAPVGPIGLLCLRRSLTDGHFIGFLSGLGAATADALYGALAALGLAFVATAIAEFHSPLQLGGGLFLLYLGARTMRDHSPLDGWGAAGERRRPALAKAASPLGAYVSTFLLTLANPMTLLAFAGIIAAAGLEVGHETRGKSAIFILGVFLGSATWWLILSTAAAWFGRHLEPRFLHRINLTCGAIIALVGIWQLVTLAARWI